MEYRIEISSVAEADADNAFLWMSQVTSTTTASQWYSGLLQAIESLSQMPKRCPLRTPLTSACQGNFVKYF
ncbi:hypothetical protein QUB80_28095 [Chlorogloeopsis sp. ULAP01]|uniref:type II toxin-antitoxin system RelE/ParE family toxin n=1 Tax=Chlorogloeopsis sp. ULAP01 TaxID=3056483 RepID=UPI0025AB1619|nr:hypothetical protein [Chlorogloeopsis sp. ULAP01]MDM9384533.1 hypothetical protein [Chlorogloeopsis sp. ULAP01]